MNLECIYDTKKSFYGKAMTREEKYKNIKATILFSYGTEVASIQEYDDGRKIFFYEGRYSQTTTRHQKEFFKQNGLSDKEIKELFKEGKLEKVV